MLGTALLVLFADLDQNRLENDLRSGQLTDIPGGANGVTRT